jgi:hypothetical protein
VTGWQTSTIPTSNTDCGSANPWFLPKGYLQGGGAFWSQSYFDFIPFFYLEKNAPLRPLTKLAKEI